MDDSETQAGWHDKARSLMGSVAPAVRAAVGASALTLLFAAVMPLAWVGALAWNLYLDRLGRWFEPPVGDAGRLTLAVFLAVLAGLIAALVALLLAKPDAEDDEAVEPYFGAYGGKGDGESDANDVDAASRRRRADMHPDAPPRPPIRAASDLPATGLGPLPLVSDEPAPDADDAGDDMLLLSMDEVAPEADESDELLLADLVDPADEAAAVPAPVADRSEPPQDISLGAMVARFEAGLDRRRQLRSLAPVAVDTATAANEDQEPVIDFALEAALSTLQRMNRHSVG